MLSSYLYPKNVLYAIERTEIIIDLDLWFSKIFFAYWPKVTPGGRYYGHEIDSSNNKAKSI